MSYYNDDDVEVEFINTTPRKSAISTGDVIVDNVIYGRTNSHGTINNNKNQETLKKMQNRDDQFYKWIKGLNKEPDIVSETHNFTYDRYTIDGKTRKKTSD